MILINFSHPITDLQKSQIEQLSGVPVHKVIEVKSQFDHALGFDEQVESLLKSVDLTPYQWQSERIVVNLPALAPAASVALANLHGRMGYYPSILRLRPIQGSTPPEFEVAEIINLQAVRDAARTQR